jgi:hypothetical protein
VSGVAYRKNVHQMLVQPFINYNFPRGWYLTSSPIITANWKAPGSEQRETARRGDWTLRVQFQLLFPK